MTGQRDRILKDVRGRAGPGADNPSASPRNGAERDIVDGVLGLAAQVSDAPTTRKPLPHG
jgi:hypothetical protein